MNWSTISPGWKTLTTRTEVLHVLWPLHVLQSCQVANRLSFRITALVTIEPMFQSGNGLGSLTGEAGGWGESAPPAKGATSTVPRAAAARRPAPCG